MQVEHAELDALVDQVVDAREKQQLERQKAEQHAGGEAAIEHQLRGKPDDSHVLQPEDQAVNRAMRDRQPLAGHARIGVLDHQVLIGAAPLGFAHVQLDRQHAAQRLDEVGAGARLVDQRLVGGAPLRVVEQPARQAVGNAGTDHDQRQQRAVPEHHEEGQHHHQAVDQRFEEGQRQRALDRVHAAEARHDVADVALLEPRQRQLQQVREQRIEQPQAQLRAQVDAEPGAHRGGGHAHQHQQREADAEHRQQVAVAADHHAVDHDLDEERRGDRQHFEHQRQQQYLQQRALQAACHAEQLPGADAAALVALPEVGGRQDLHRHAGVVARGLLQRHHAAPDRRVVQRDLVAGDRGQHHEVVHVPVQDRGQLQLAERLQRRLQPARRHLHLLGQRGDVLERDAAHRRRQPAAHRGQVGAQAVVAGDHRHTGDAALGRLGLQDQRNAAAEHDVLWRIRSAAAARIRAPARTPIRTRCAFPAAGRR